MALSDAKAMVMLEELIVSTLAMTNALTKLLIEKGVITDQELTEKLSQQQATYQVILKKMPLQ